MRYISFILSIYFLWLSTVFCKDGIQPDNCQSVVCVHVEQGQQDDDDCNACSPFCLCSCCHGFTLMTDFQTANLVLPQTTTLSSYSEHSPQEISRSIWQPPKV